MLTGKRHDGREGWRRRTTVVVSDSAGVRSELNWGAISRNGLQIGYQIRPLQPLWYWIRVVRSEPIDLRAPLLTPLDYSSPREARSTQSHGPWSQR